jgi:predicted dehydrogenase
METLRKLSTLYDVVGVVESDPHRRERIASQAAYQDVPILTEEELLDTHGLQAVAVETDIPPLIPTARRCLERGLHVHLDKPAGLSMNELRSLHTAASKRKLCIQMGYMFRYNSAIRLMHQAITSGWLGEVFEVHGVMSKKIGAAERQQLARFGGGSMFELGCHLIDVLVWFLGKPSAVHSFVDHVGSDGLADNVLAVFEYPKGSATIRSSVVEPSGNRRRQLTVVGTEGVAETRPLEPAQLEFVFERASGPYKPGIHRPELEKTAGRYHGDLTDLAAVILGQKELRWDATHDLAVQETLLLASGMPINT